MEQPAYQSRVAGPRARRAGVMVLDMDARLGHRFILAAAALWLGACGGGEAHSQTPAVDDPAPPAEPDAAVRAPAGRTATEQPAAISTVDLGGLRPARAHPMGGGKPLSLPQLLTLPGVPTDAQWRALPPTADASLSRIAGDAAEEPPVRVRAISGLTVRAVEGAGPGLATLLADTAAPAAVRRASARALGAAFIEQETARAALIATLADPVDTLRETAARALRPHRERPEIAAAFAERRAVEPLDHIRELFAE